MAFTKGQFQEMATVSFPDMSLQITSISLRYALRRCLISILADICEWQNESPDVVEIVFMLDLLAFVQCHVFSASMQSNQC